MISRSAKGAESMVTKKGNDAKIGWFMIRVNDQNRIILVICFS